MLKNAQVLTLLKQYHQIKASLDTLALAIAFEEKHSNNTDGIIYSTSLSQNANGMPFPPEGSTGDKVYNVLHSYPQIAKEELRDAAYLRLVRDTREHVLNQIDTAVSHLQGADKILVVEGYIGGISTPELIETYDEVRFLSDSSLKRRKADAVKQIAQMLVVSEEQYQMVILNMNEL